MMIQGSLTLLLPLLALLSSGHAAPAPAPTVAPNVNPASGEPVPGAPDASTNSNNPIKKGYVAFGDSYAAGIGTGTTSMDGCRRGEFSYPKQIASYSPSDIDFQNLPCSGAKLEHVLSGGPSSQIDAWTNPGNADIATLTIGGNDLGFYNILTACVIRVGGLAAGNCDDEINKALDIVHGMDFINDFGSVLHQIIDKSGRPDFRIFVMGYPSFFNTDTEWCNDVTFSIWNPHHGPWQPGYSNQWLSKELRLKVNNLVAELNTILSQKVLSVNGEYGLPFPPRVTFIDPNFTYNTHRFCEIDDGNEVQEPTDDREDTWFFLSNWKDWPIPDDPEAATSSANEDSQEQQQQLAGNTTALPDPNTCGEVLDFSSNYDWGMRMECEVAQVLNQPQSAEYQVLMQEMQTVADHGDLTTLEVPWWVFTRQAKTFHPRSQGQQALANLIKNAW